MLERLFIVSGSAVERAEFSPGASVSAWNVQAPKARLKPHSINIPNLPSEAGILVKRGDRVTAGQILARYVNDSQLAVLERQAKQKRQGAEEIRAAARIGERRFRVERSKLEGLLSAAQRKVKTLEFLVARDAEPRIKLEEARGVIKGLESEQTRLILDFTSQAAAQENRARALEVEAVGVDAQLEGLKEKWYAPLKVDEAD